MNGEFLAALERIEREKGISKEVLLEAIESALVSAARKVIDDPDISKEDISVTMDPDSGAIKVYSEGEEVNSERFGRIAAQTAKQVIIQKIREAERDVIYEKYSTRTGTIISGAVHRFEKGSVVVELDDTEAIMPRGEQIPRERFRQGEQLRAYLKEVRRGPGGPEIILSRAAEGFVKKLFELEVPEISQGIVEIRSIAREAGERTKIAVYSKDEKVDAVGACVGMRGSRVRDIVKELHGERIDIVRWNDDIRELLKAALSPATITRMIIDRESTTISLTVPKDQLAIVIGKKGSNIRMASRLLGWELEVESEETAAMADIPVSDIEGLTDKQKEVLMEAGLDTIGKLGEAGLEGLMELDGVGNKTAESILEACERTLEAVMAEAEEEEEKEKKREEEAEEDPSGEEEGTPEEDNGAGEDADEPGPEKKEGSNEEDRQAAEAVSGQGTDNAGKEDHEEAPVEERELESEDRGEVRPDEDEDQENDGSPEPDEEEKTGAGD
ncbi:MAG: transcription termination factor NusA [Candidatus Omnitrophica bacterium]|nr:transcription termination factor NusA [Candidatus Omnitrophota bacterium]